MNTLHIWSDIPGQLFKASTKSDADGTAKRAATAGHRTLVEQVMDVNDVIRLFKRLAKEGSLWSTVNFHTHGSGGSISLGSTHLNLTSLPRLENQDFDRVFAAGCTITFDGCNVAEGPEGEFFLVEVGDTLLGLKGGKVRGNTGAGFGSWGGSESVHPFGDWITATVGPGGTIKFDKLIHLNADRIQQRIAALPASIARNENNFRHGEKQELEECFANAKSWGVGRWTARLQSCLWLDQADAKLEVIEYRSMRRPSR